MHLDPARSRVAIYTFAEGLFSALAHDLQLVAGDLEGQATSTSAEIQVPTGSIRVRGVMKRGKLEPGVLSDADRENIERQVREDVLPGPIAARGVLPAGGPGRASIEIAAPRATTHVVCNLRIVDEDGGKRVKGEAEVSLASLGAPPVKGPMGAFRVKDRVRVEIDLMFR